MNREQMQRAVYGLESLSQAVRSFAYGFERLVQGLRELIESVGTEDEEES